MDPLPAAGEAVGVCPACGAAERTPAVEVRTQMQSGDRSFTFVRCDECGLTYLHPRVAATALAAYYPDHYLPYRGPEAWGPFAPLVAGGVRAVDRRRVALLRRLVGLDEPCRVLDVGCGKPTFLEALVRDTGCLATGVDFADSGWRDSPGRWAELDLRVGELGDLAFEEPFDVVTMWHYLEHDYHPASTLTRVRRLVTPDARLVIEVPDHEGTTRVRHGANWAGYHAPRHTALYDSRTIRTLLESSGWEVVSVVRSGSLDPYVLEWMSRMERRGIDWSRSLGGHFPGYLLGKLLWELRTRGRKEGHGVLTAVARPGRNVTGSRGGRVDGSPRRGT